MTNREKCLEVFEKELSLIKDLEIKEYILDCFDKFCPDYFWVAPASITGLFHPWFSQGEGGITRHTKMVVYWALELTKVFALSERYNDILIASSILHDLRKNGDSLEEKKEQGMSITKSHGYVLAQKLKENLSKDFSHSCWKDYIIRCVEGHMGVWSAPSEVAPAIIKNKTCSTYDNNISELLSFVVHLADYCASRKLEYILKEALNIEINMEKK